MRYASAVCAGLLLSLALLASTAVAADDPTDAPPTAAAITAPSSQTDVDNGDGTWTFTQVIDENSTPPEYLGPFYSASRLCDYGNYYGFNIYSWYDEDYGWTHSFPHWADANLQILSATLTIQAWDVDSEVEHGYYGEYDGVHVDGTLLDPGYLQGTNQTWSVTNFSVPTTAILDDGVINTFLDIDLHHAECWWATTLDYSKLVIRYSVGGVEPNQAPFAPVLAMVPAKGCPTDGEDLVVNVTGPVPADPDGDAVTYSYRWFVDVGTGGFVDDEFAGRGDHTGNVVPAADTQPLDVWRVQVTPTDEHGAIGPYTTVTFGQVGGATPAQKVTWAKVKVLYR